MTENARPLRLTDRKRAAIIEAAADEFRSRGYENTSMDGIAEAAGVSKRTVYNHFPSKEDLFAAIVRMLKTRCDELTNYEYDPQAPLDEQLTEIGRCALSLFASEEFVSLARVILPRFLESPELARTTMGEPDEGVVKWIADAQAAGRLEVPHVKRAGKQFLGLLNSLAFWPQVISGDPAPTPQAQEEILADAIAMFLSRYAAQGR